MNVGQLQVIQYCDRVSVMGTSTPQQQQICAVDGTQERCGCGIAQGKAGSVLSFPVRSAGQTVQMITLTL